MMKISVDSFTFPLSSPLSGSDMSECIYERFTVEIIISRKIHVILNIIFLPLHCVIRL